MLDYSARVPNIYKTAAKIAKEVVENKGSLKNLIYEQKSGVKGLYALVVKTIKYNKQLEIVLEKSKILEKDPKLDIWLAKVFITELIWGKGTLPSGCKPTHIILTHKQIINDLALELNEASDGIQVYKPRYVRINTLLISVKEAIEAFQNEGWILIPFTNTEDYDGFIEKMINLKPDEFMTDIHIKELLVFPASTDFHDHRALKDGLIFLQDKASCIPVQLLNPKPESIVLDMCAAPGMKTSHIACKLENKGKVYAVDLHLNRLKLVDELIERCGINCVKTIHNDVFNINDRECPNVEYILVDPSCSGSGIIDRVETTENVQVDEKRIEKLFGFQVMTLKRAFRHFPLVKRIVYSTCSLNTKENEGVVREVIQNCSAFKLIDCRTLMPNWRSFGSEQFGEIGKRCLYARPEVDHTNGFFVAVFERLEAGEVNEFLNPSRKGFKREQKDVDINTNITNKTSNHSLNERKGFNKGNQKKKINQDSQKSEEETNNMLCDYQCDKNENETSKDCSQKVELPKLDEQKEEIDNVKKKNKNKKRRKEENVLKNNTNEGEGSGMNPSKTEILKEGITSVSTPTEDKLIPKESKRKHTKKKVQDKCESIPSRDSKNSVEVIKQNISNNNENQHNENNEILPKKKKKAKKRNVSETGNEKRPLTPGQESFMDNNESSKKEKTTNKNEKLEICDEKHPITPAQVENKNSIDNNESPKKKKSPIKHEKSSKRRESKQVKDTENIQSEKHNDDLGKQLQDAVDRLFEGPQGYKFIENKLKKKGISLESLSSIPAPEENTNRKSPKKEKKSKKSKVEESIEDFTISKKKITKQSDVNKETVDKEEKELIKDSPKKRKHMAKKSIDTFLVANAVLNNDYVSLENESTGKLSLDNSVIKKTPPENKTRNSKSLAEELRQANDDREENGTIQKKHKRKSHLSEDLRENVKTEENKKKKRRSSLMEEAHSNLNDVHKKINNVSTSEDQLLNSKQYDIKLSSSKKKKRVSKEKPEEDLLVNDDKSEQQLKKYKEDVEKVKRRKQMNEENFAVRKSLSDFLETLGTSETIEDVNTPKVHNDVNKESKKRKKKSVE